MFYGFFEPLFFVRVVFLFHVSLGCSGGKVVYINIHCFVLKLLTGFVIIGLNVPGLASDVLFTESAVYKY